MQELYGTVAAAISTARSDHGPHVNDDVLALAVVKALVGGAQPVAEPVAEPPAGELRLRRILPLLCTVCKHRWIAPAKGACPKCHSDQTIQQGDERTETAPRV
jgi:hypothetical protein